MLSVVCYYLFMHSFPTRRSSDLHSQRDQACSGCGCGDAFDASQPVRCGDQSHVGSDAGIRRYVDHSTRLPAPAQGFDETHEKCPRTCSRASRSMPAKRSRCLRLLTAIATGSSPPGTRYEHRAPQTTMRNGLSRMARSFWRKVAATAPLRTLWSTVNVKVMIVRSTSSPPRRTG